MSQVEPTTAETADLGVSLRRSADESPTIDRLAEATGGRVGVTAVLDDLDRSARPSFLPRVLGRAVDEAYAWDSRDQRDPVWWPQGITTSADAHPSGRVAGRRLVVTTWYAKPIDGAHRGVRLTFLDLDTLRYRHVLLVAPFIERGTEEGRARVGAVRIHAGGLVWAGDWLHVAATARGFVSCHVDDLLRVPDTVGGHAYVLPVRFRHRASTAEGREPLRHSFLSLDRGSEPPGLVTGEYGRGRQNTRLVRYQLDPATWLPATDGSGNSRPVLSGLGVRRMQGDAVVAGRHHVSVSQGSWVPGSVFTGSPGALRQHRYAMPMGPEDMAYVPQTDRLWSVSEHPRRRWVWSMRRSWFG